MDHIDLTFFFKGIVLGFLIAAPVGPIGILCIRKTLQFGRFSGFFTGLGAAIADTIYGIVAVFSLTFIANFLIEAQFWLRLMGGAFLIYLGMKTFLAKPREKFTKVSHQSLLKDFLVTFFLTLTNPMTILSYVGAFTALGLAITRENYSKSSWLILGVFLGSAIWWLMLSEGVTLFRKQVTQKMMTLINRVAGLLISVFGVLVWLSIFLKFIP